MIIRARTPSLIMQGDVQVPIQAIRRPEAAGGLFDIIARITVFCATTPTPESMAPVARLTRSRACTDAAELEQSEQRAR